MRRDERYRGVGQVIQGQQYASGDLLVPGQLQQAPAEQQADRQAADVAEKDLRHRPVERRKADAARHTTRRLTIVVVAGTSPSQPSRAMAALTGTASADRHQVEPVHEVDEVHEPEAGQQHEAAFDPERKQRRRSCKLVGRGKDDGRDGRRLQQQPRQHPNRMDVIGKAHGRDEQRRAETRWRGFSWPM